MRDRFIVYTKPDGKVTKDFERKKRTSLACSNCRRGKIKCDFRHPCSSCNGKGRASGCLYENEQKRARTLERSTSAEGDDLSPPSPVVLTPDSQNDCRDRSEGSGDTLDSSPSGCQLFGTAGGGVTKNYVGLWHADVTVHKEPGVRSLLAKFETMKSEKKLECMRPWQRQESPGSQTYVDPFLCGIETEIVIDLINVYWQYVNPIESVIEPKLFWQEFDRHRPNGDRPFVDKRARILFSIRVWIMLAYATRSLGDNDWLVQKVRSDLQAGIFVFSVDSTIQKSPQFVQDPWEFFLHCAETCISACNLYATLYDLYTLETFVLYISYLHDGSDRNWISWTYLGMANHSAQRIGLNRDPEELNDTDIDAHRHRKLLFNLVIMNSLYAVDLGQTCIAFPESFISMNDKLDEFVKQQHDGEYILCKYRLVKLLNKSIETVSSLYHSDIKCSQLSPLMPGILDMERQIDEVWGEIPLSLRLREAPSHGEAGRIRLDIALKLEEPAAPPKVLLQRYIIDTLIQKIRHVFYRPFLKIRLQKDSRLKTHVLEFQEKFQSSARALLENQFEVSNKTDDELLEFRKFRWNYIFSHAFHASVLLCLQKKSYQRDASENQLLRSSIKLYKSIRSHVGCSAAKAYLVLSALLEEDPVEQIESSVDTSPSSDQLKSILPTIPTDLSNFDEDFFTFVLGDPKYCE